MGDEALPRSPAKSTNLSRREATVRQRSTSSVASPFKGACIVTCPTEECATARLVAKDCATSADCDVTIVRRFHVAAQREASPAAAVGGVETPGCPGLSLPVLCSSQGRCE